MIGLPVLPVNGSAFLRGSSAEIARPSDIIAVVAVGFAIVVGSMVDYDNDNERARHICVLH